MAASGGREWFSRIGLRHVAAVEFVDSDGDRITGSGGPTAADVGSLTEDAPATDTASSGLNGRLQRIAQNITTLITAYAAGVLAPNNGAVTSVNDQATSVTVLAAHTGRKGAAFFNDSTALLYLLCAAGTASATNYTVQIPAGGYYELPMGRAGPYTNIVSGIWASDASGAVRVTQWT